MIYDIIDNVLPREFNESVVSMVSGTPRWQIGVTEYGGKDTSDPGIMMNSFLYGQDELYGPNSNVIFAPLNALALSIANTVLAKHNGRFVEVTPKRFFWNRYTRNGVCAPHQDCGGQLNPDEHIVSLVYHLNDNDGYNIINGERIDNVNGRCIIFQSTDWHEANGPFEAKERFTLNAVLGYYNYEKGQ